MAFTGRSTVTPFPLTDTVVKREDDVTEALLWTASRTPNQVAEYREAVTRRIEKRANDFRFSGATAEWLMGVDAELAPVIASVNDALLEELASESRSRDDSAMDAQWSHYARARRW